MQGARFVWTVCVLLLLWLRGASVAHGSIRVLPDLYLCACVCVCVCVLCVYLCVYLVAVVMTSARRVAAHLHSFQGHWLLCRV